MRDCAKFIEPFALGALRNDLAITRFHLGDAAGCRAALAPLGEYLKTSDEEFKNTLPPAEADASAVLAQSTRFNWRKCAAR
ncbi:hypothetical protein [Ramlibacter sp.]|uniref:hypothetical protein n=1 Tax=Ramlibacter sp. TaxID=1917967 RepID=UPI00184F0BF8|nr:hypothetical protein [Ramlibacter sp.]MBA2674122.1 hypothetical protein [Ramlibacter sp.]